MHLTRSASLSKPSPALLSALAPLVALAIGGTMASDARAADEKEACVRAVDHAQVARLDGKLREAREGLMVCARAVCPNAIREDCTRWLAEVDASLPSVVFEAVWADGRDVTGMKVLLDGQPLAGAEGGRAVTLDPGAHTFRFEAAGAAPVETRNVIREGEKNRIIRVSFAAPAPTAIAPPAIALVPPPAPPPEPSATATSVPSVMWQPVLEDSRASSRRGPVPPLAYVFGGGALLGLGGFVYFGLAGTNQLNSLRATCVHDCNPSDVNSARNEILVGDILGFVALAATGVATWLVLTRPHVAGTMVAR
jgi:hypothetical protein